MITKQHSCCAIIGGSGVAAIAALSCATATGTPLLKLVPSGPALAARPGESSVRTAFRHWAATVRWASQGGLGDDECDRRADMIIDAEQALAALPAADGDDFACKAYLSIYAAVSDCRRDNPVMIGDDADYLARSALADLATHFPEVYRIIAAPPSSGVI